MTRIKGLWSNPAEIGWVLTWHLIITSGRISLFGMIWPWIMWKRKILLIMNFICMPIKIRTIVFMMRMESLLRSFLQEIGILCIMLIWRKRIRVHIHLFKIILILIGELFRHCDYKDVLVIPDNLIKGIYSSLRNLWIIARKQILKRKELIFVPIHKAINLTGIWHYNIIKCWEYIRWTWAWEAI